MHSHNPPTSWAGLARVFFACGLLHVYRGVILDLTWPMGAPEGLPQIQEPAESQQGGGG